MKTLLVTTFAAVLLVSCGSPFAPSVEKQAAPQSTPKPVTTQRQAVAMPPAPPSTHVDKEVEDSNYQEHYMYPEDGSAAKKDPIVKEETPTSSVTATETMTKEACIAMIGQEKFDKYSEMFGNEEASIKRCGMMKAMQK
ncbi:MAG: hypothetical protein GQ531_08025 [Sulfurovum sp.]|nr:hypothetical protein [Sulfurovum sp.]